MSRELRPIKQDGTYVDDNTFVGYDFIKKEYYVKNLNTKTVASSAQEAKLLFDITAPGNVVTVAEIEALSTTLEQIQNIYYTLEDNGRYIKTISFNDYDELAIQYDEHYLYIRGSNEMWDMASSVGADSVSLFMWQYYVYYVGLDMNRVLMDAIINYFKKIQSPYVYNTIVPRTDEDKEEDKPLMYTNQCIMNNADQSSRGEYTGTKNPNNIANLNTYNIVTASDNIITCDVVPECNVGDILQITSPGTLHIDNLVVDHTGGNNIYTATPIGVSISSTDEAKVWIKAYGVIRSGYNEIIEIKNAQEIQKIEDYASTSKVYIIANLCEGMYQAGENVYINGVQRTISSVSTSYNETESPYAYVPGYIILTEKIPEYTALIGRDPLMLEIRDTSKQLENSFTLTTPLDVENGDEIEITNSGGANIDGIYTVDYVEGNRVFVTTEENKEVPEFTFDDANRPMVQFRMPSQMILLEMSYSKRADKVPVGTFMLDNDEQFTQYLELYYITPPTAQNYSCFNQTVIDKYNLGDDLMYNAKNTADYLIVEDAEELKKTEGTIGQYAFVYKKSGASAKFTRYMYVGTAEDPDTHDIYQNWETAPTPVYMSLKGLYSEKYEDL